MAVFTKEVYGLIKRLIKSIRSFAGEDENYEWCFQFCISNLKYHKYLDISSTYVTRAIENVATMFKVHSLPERAHQLLASFEKFLKFDPYSNSTLHYKVLHFLFNLSVSPTNVNYCLPNCLELLEGIQLNDNFDWNEYLMNGIVIPSFYDSTSGEISSLSGVKSSFCEEENTIHKTFTTVASATCRHYNGRTGHDMVYLKALSWLKDCVYWVKYEYRNTVGHCLFDFLFKRFYENKRITIVSEAQIVRETLWILMGITSGCVYNKIDLSVNENIAMSHLSLSSLHQFLNEFSHLGCQLKVIRGRISSSFSDTSQVFQGSMYFIRNYIDEINCCLREKEMNISKKRNFCSLLNLKTFLSHHKREVHCVYSVLESVENQNSILDVLWRHLEYHESTSNRQCMNIVFPWILATLRPFLNIMNKWLTEGKIDSNSDFLVIRNTMEAKSWTDSFTLSDIQPLCIKPLAKKILIAGKSWCFIKSLDKESFTTISASSLYDEFITILCHEVNQATGDNKFNRQNKLVIQNQCHASLSINHYTPVIGAITSSIQQCINAQYKKATSSLTDILKTEYNLLEHFDGAQKFFLMEAGHVMHMFASKLFKQMMSGSSWLEKSFLISILKEAIQVQYNNYENLLSMEVNPMMPSHVSFESLKAFSLQYEIKWPIDIFFPQILIDYYDQIFTFLLQVKFAKWCLIAIDIRKYKGRNKCYSTLLHRLFLFRAKLLHFVDSLNHYLLTRILHTSGIKFQESCSQANDLNTITVLHTDYVNQIHDRCLLNKKAHLVKEAILQTLTLTLTLYNLWNKGIKWCDGARIEIEFMRCIHFLVSCLDKHVKRGSFPHLETLLFTLRSLLSGPKYFQL